MYNWTPGTVGFKYTPGSYGIRIPGDDREIRHLCSGGTFRSVSWVTLILKKRSTGINTKLSHGK